MRLSTARWVLDYLKSGEWIYKEMIKDEHEKDSVFEEGMRVALLQLEEAIHSAEEKIKSDNKKAS